MTLYMLASATWLQAMAQCWACGTGSQQILNTCSGASDALETKNCSFIAVVQNVEKAKFRCPLLCIDFINAGAEEELRVAVCNNYRV